MLCHHGCGRSRNRTTWACCTRRPTSHTPICAQRHARLQQSTSPMPLTTTPEPASSPVDQESPCPVCLEQVTHPHNLPCQLVLCQNCWQGLLAFRHRRYPLCRGLLSEDHGTDSHTTGRSRGPASSTETPPQEQWLGFVVLSTPTDLRHNLGLHVVGWSELERRLGHTPGTLAGHLRKAGVQLREVRSVPEAQHWWDRWRLQGPLPRL